MQTWGRLPPSIENHFTHLASENSGVLGVLHELKRGFRNAQGFRNNWKCLGKQRAGMEKRTSVTNQPTNQVYEIHGLEMAHFPGMSRI